MATRFYFHASTNSTSGLPTTKQSSLSVESGKGDALTLNRLMNTDIGTSQASIAITSINDTSAHNYYFTRFASQSVYQSSIAANTWTLFFATQESNTSANFPVTANNKAIRITCYVWRPSNSSLVGWILEGASAATVDEGSSGSELAKVVTFSGSEVLNVQDGDVIIFEVIFQITQGAATAYTDTYYFDGTTTYTDGTPASSAASYLETPENLALSPQQDITRTISESTIDISETQITRLSEKQRAPSSQSTTIDENITTLLAKQRTIADESTNTGESVTQQKTGGGPKNVEKTISESVSSLSDSYNRLAAKWRKIG